MATIREKMESVFAAVAFAERDRREEAVQLAKDGEDRQARAAEEQRRDSRPRAGLRAE